MRARTVQANIILVVIFVFSVLSTGFSPPVLTDGSGGLRLFPWQVRALGELGQVPDVSARAALIADADTGAILHELNGDRVVPPASTTKMMTALLVLENASLDDMVTVSPIALTIGEASMSLVQGEQLSVHDLLHGLLLVSANDAAMALAVHVSGSVEGFVEEMNKRAGMLGMTNTNFMNPHGLDFESHHSSAKDLLLLAREALRVAEFREIVAKSEATVAGRYLVNTNQLLTSYEGTEGVKTGTTDLAGQCLVVLVRRNSTSLLVIVLGSDDRYEDARNLLNFGFANYLAGAVGLPGGPLSEYLDSSGRRWRIEEDGSHHLLLPAWKWPLLQAYRYVELPPGPPTEIPAGSARYSIGRDTVAQSPLYLTEGW